MTNQEIKDRAPDGAEFYNDDCGWVVYARLTSFNVVETWLDGEWYSTRLHKSECELKPL